ncbi:uncharacterized protein H6S33_000698, partial [Morchella sextelata]|uniref:uncharacterized protein n=1 Tax=Morchella sextelata TaxID=1174677 RepID=UPI001D045EA9
MMERSKRKKRLGGRYMYIRVVVLAVTVVDVIVDVMKVVVNNYIMLVEDGAETK